MGRTINIHSFIVLVFLLTPGISFAKTKAILQQSLCADSAGNLLVRKKCKNTEQKISLSLLAKTGVGSLNVDPSKIGPPGIQGILGQQGPQGIAGIQGVQGAKGVLDFSACRIITGTDTNFGTSSSYASPILACDQNTEFVFDYDFSVGTDAPFGSAGTHGFLQAVGQTYSLGNNNESLPYKVETTLNRGINQNGGNFYVIAHALCCPR
jgi:hypothetical protein